MAALYTLEIYEPGSLTEVWVSVESETPFSAISAGDLINLFTGSQVGATPPDPPNLKNAGGELQVTQVEHIVWADDPKNIRHKLMVFTKEIRNRRGIGEFKTTPLRMEP